MYEAIWRKIPFHLLMVVVFACSSCGSVKTQKVDITEHEVYEKALAAFENAERLAKEHRVHLNPYSPEYSEFTRSLSDAEISIDEYLFFYPEGESAPELMLKKGKLFDFGMRQQFMKAIQVYEELTVLYPESEEAKTARDRALYLRSRFDGVIETPHGIR